MKKSARSLAALLVIVTVVAAGFFIWDFSHRRMLETASSEQMLETTLAVLENWNPAALVQQAAPALLQTKSTADIEANFRNLSRHGELLQTQAMQGQVLVPSLLQRETPSTARYTVHASFTRGRARIEAELIYLDGEWRFTAYQVYSSIQAS